MVEYHNSRYDSHQHPDFAYGANRMQPAFDGVYTGDFDRRYNDHLIGNQVIPQVEFSGQATRIVIGDSYGYGGNYHHPAIASRYGYGGPIYRNLGVGNEYQLLRGPNGWQRYDTGGMPYAFCPAHGGIHPGMGRADYRYSGSPEMYAGMYRHGGGIPTGNYRSAYGYGVPYENYPGNYRHGQSDYRYADPRYADPRRRVAEFDRAYVYGGFGQGDFRGEMQQFRDRYRDQFRERQRQIIERNRGGNRRLPEAAPPIERPEERAPQPQKEFDGELPGTPDGFVPEKWNDLNHRTPKYAVGRAVAADLLPALARIEGKEAKQRVAEQFLRERRHLIEREGLSVLGYDGEKVLVKDSKGKDYVIDTVGNIGLRPDQTVPGWAITDDPSQIDYSAFRR